MLKMIVGFSFLALGMAQGAYLQFFVPIKADATNMFMANWSLYTENWLLVLSSCVFSIFGALLAMWDIN